MDKIARIRQEIERRIADNTFGAKLELIDLLSWLDPIEERPCEVLEEEIERIVKDEEKFMNFQVRHQLIQYVARHFAEWQYQKDREEFAKIKAKTWSEGFNDCKEQMLKEAVEAIISQCPGSNEIIFHNPITIHSWEFPWKFSAKGLKKGDKVKLIIVKED